MDEMQESQGEIELSQRQKERIERNRQRARVLKQSKLVSHPYSKGDVVSIDKTTIKVGATKYKDTGGGFLLEEEPDKEETPFILAEEEEVPLFEADWPSCETCKKPFPSSWLFDSFGYKVCDKCKNPDIHKLITRTEAMKEYLLKDVDLDKRDPPLKFITKKNPHNVYWGEMKLYLHPQVEQRALEIWENFEKIEEELEKREEKKVVLKTKKYHKQMKELRMKMRSSLYDRTTKASHTHEFGPETYNEDNDDYTHTCLTCEYEETFEKM